jgi:hypothetical protein
MQRKSLKLAVLILSAGGWMMANVSCIPNRDQINSMIQSSVLNGVGLAITLGIDAALRPQITPAE